jgi:preprotein translocase subunit SecA
LDPRDEFRIDGARAFVSLVETLREDIVKNIFFFVGASAEPIADFESLGEEGASQTQTEV